MKQQTKKIIISILAIVLALLMIVPLLMEAVLMVGEAASTVSSLNDKLSKLDKEKAAIQEDLNRVRSEKKSATAEKEALDRKISVTAQEIATINEIISQLDAQSTQCQKDLDTAKAKEAETYTLFKQRIRAMEENGRVSYLTVILAADSFSEMLSRAEIIGNVMSYDRGIMNDLKQQQATIAQKQTEIAENKKAQESAKLVLKARKSELDEQEAEATTLLKELNAEEKAYKKAYDEAETAQAAARAEIKRLTTKSGSSSKYVGGDLTWPVPGKYTITSPYGYRKDPITRVRSKHTGIDIAAGTGTPIVAANSGTVIVSGWSSRGYGNYIVIDHGGGKSTLYAHQSRLAVSKGTYVKKGQTIGYVGSTGYSTGPHLHFEVLINGDDTNPMNYFTKG